MPASLAVRAVVMRTGTAGGEEAARGAAVAGATAAAAGVPAVGAGPAGRPAGAQPPGRTPAAASRPAERVTVLDMALPLRRCRAVSRSRPRRYGAHRRAVPVVVGCGAKQDLRCKADGPSSPRPAVSVS